MTSGGGFSVYADRDKDAPWQSEVVDYYLKQTAFGTSQVEKVGGYG